MSATAQTDGPLPEWVADFAAQQQREKRWQRRARFELCTFLLLLCGAGCAVQCANDPGAETDGRETEWSVAALGDVDGDGVGDFALRTAYDPTSAEQLQSVWVCSGRTAKPLYAVQFECQMIKHPVRLEVRMPSPSAFAVVGDVDGDGGSDYCVGVPYDWWHARYLGDVRLLSGRTGRLIWVVRDESEGRGFGRLVTSVGDLDADGVADLAFSVEENYLHGLPGEISLRSGRSGRLLERVVGPRVADPDDSFPKRIQAQHFGQFCLALQDLDTDGVPDFAVSAPWHRSLRYSMSASGDALHVYSGRTRELLWTASERERLVGTPRFDFGDRDGDGRTDMLTSERLLSGADGSTLPEDPIWNEIDAIFELDGDGDPEWLLRTRAAPNRARVIRGRDGAPAFDIEVAPHYEDFAPIGAFVVLGDLNGDGVRELAAASNRGLDFANYRWTPDFGLVTIHSGSDGSVLKHITRETLREAASAGCPMLVSRIDG